jgi:dihydropteroate synthase
MLSLRRRPPGGLPMVMGILNVTPDSFSDGGMWTDPRAAVRHAFEMEDAGADVIDIGAESTRPSSVPVSAEEEASRLVPVLKEVLPSLGVPVSVDTMKPEVARTAVGLGVQMVNDVCGLGSPEMVRVCAESGAAVAIMHMPRGMSEVHSHAMGDDYMREIRSFLHSRAQDAIEAGVRRDGIILDPGVGFGKTPEQNAVISRSARYFSGEFPVLIATSRKRFLSYAYPGMGREEASVRSACEAAAWGADMVRVHDVASVVEALREGIRQRG